MFHRSLPRRAGFTLAPEKVWSNFMVLVVAGRVYLAVISLDLQTKPAAGQAAIAVTLL